MNIFSRIAVLRHARRIVPFSARSRKHVRFARCETLEPRHMLAGDPVITEFMASNDTTLLDGDANSSDWIEIYNQGDASLSLDGWYLSDDADDLTKWPFPNQTLDAGEYLVVFASGQPTIDYTDGTGNLHTNFRLTASGDFLSLVHDTPSGIVVATQYGSAEAGFPDQKQDVSFGLAEAEDSVRLVSVKTPVNVLIPDAGDDAAYGSNWTGGDELAFDAAGGLAGWTDDTITGIGFDANSAVGFSGLKLDFNDKFGDSAAIDTLAGFEAFRLADSGTTLDGVTVTLSALGGARLDDRDRATPVDSLPDLTQAQLYDDFIFANGTFDGAGIEIMLEGLLPNQRYDLTIWSFDSGSTGQRRSTWSQIVEGDSVSLVNPYTFDGSALPGDDFDSSFTVAVVASDFGVIEIQGIRSGGTSHGVFLNALELSSVGFGDLIESDLLDMMRNQNPSAFARIPFEVDDLAAFANMSLSMQFDDGFVAYLNGQEIARSNAPGDVGDPLSFDAAATSALSGAGTFSTEQYNVTAALPLLKQGTNILAIHGLNVDSADGDFLIVPELTASSGPGLSQRYFTQPTPGAPNVTGFIAFVADTRFDMDRGFYDTPFDVQITTATDGATIYYTTDGSQPSLRNSAAQVYDGPITISTTTMLRAVAFKQDYQPTNIDTQTYIFLDDVIRQDIANLPGSYPSTWQAGFAGDYNIDPDVATNSNSQYFAPTLKDDLKAIPTMSIVMDHDDLWGSSGIYNNSTSRGEAWRRAGSVEYFDPNTGEQFQVDAGIQIHGGASRDNVRQLKHSFRLLFRKDFGESKLNFPLFDGAEVDQFNTIVLKAFFTDGFATRTAPGRYSPVDSQYLRDVWMRDTQLAMGNLSADSTYVHLYINGLYWGLYNPSERPDEAFLAEHLGGERDDYDIVKDFNELFSGSKTAWNQMFAIANAGLSSDSAYQRIQGNNPDGTPNPNLPNLLDVDNLIDFMILHLYAGAEDWPHHNWYAGRDRVGETKGFQFFVWDQEIVLDGRYRDRTEVDNDFTPARLYSQLRANEEFRLRFADRVQKHLFNGGALSVEANQARWLARADEIEQAIVGESARWGDARDGDPSPTNNIRKTMTQADWLIERDNVMQNYFPRSQELTIARFTVDGLISEINAAEFKINGESQHGGSVTTGSLLSMTAKPSQQVIDEELILPEFSVATAIVATGSIDALIGADWFRTDFAEGAAGESGWKIDPGGVGYDTASTYDQLINLDVESDMAGKQTSVFTRFRFDYDGSEFDQLFLKMKYDDGFVAYLNGVEIANANAPGRNGNPGTLAWDSAATISHNDSDAIVFEDFDITAFSDLLVAGETNVLAIHGLNVAVGSSDMLISPEIAGRVASGGDNQQIYYTLDGTDPRLFGGAISPAAILYDGEFEIASSGQVISRTKSGNGWSASNEAFYTAISPLRITELMYNPTGSDDLEFIEIMNTGPESVDLQGVSLVDGVEFTFTQIELASGQRIVVARNEEAFQTTYGEAINFAGQYGGTPEDFRFSNGGESIVLVDAQGGVIQSFVYDDAWYPTTDSGGFSLTIIDTGGDYSSPENWRPSIIEGGTPGTDDVGPSLVGDLNGDLHVGVADLKILQSNFGRTDGVTQSDGDLNGDSLVGATDFRALVSHYGESQPAPPAAAPAYLGSVDGPHDTITASDSQSIVIDMGTSRSRIRFTKSLRANMLPGRDRLQTSDVQAAVDQVMTDSGDSDGQPASKRMTRSGRSHRIERGVLDDWLALYN